MQLNPTNTVKSALIVEGGAMSCIFSAGILDRFIAANFYPFTYYLGVSAGASNLAAYLGRQYGRNYKVYTEYCLNKAFKNGWRFLRGGHFIDIDWLWEVTERDLPIGLEHIAEYGERFKIIATCASTGEAHYLTPNGDELFAALKCSGNMPLVFKGDVNLRGKTWFDGGIADSLPVQKAYDMGARHIMVLRSNDAGYTKKPYKINRLFPYLLKPYPAVVERIQKRYLDYNRALDFIANPPPDCQVVNVCPPSDLALGQFTTNVSQLNKGYELGLAVGDQLVEAYS